jgi:hypothetical protein
MVTADTTMSLAYGPPALLGLVVRRTPRWSGLASFGAALAVGMFGTFALNRDVVANLLVVVPVSVVMFFLSRAVRERSDAPIRHAHLGRPRIQPAEVPSVEDPRGGVKGQMNSLIRFSRYSCRPLVFGVTSPFLSM